MKYSILYRNSQYGTEIHHTVQKFTILYRNPQYCQELDEVGPFDNRPSTD